MRSFEPIFQHNLTADEARAFSEYIAKLVEPYTRNWTSEDYARAYKFFMEVGSGARLP